MLPIDLARTDLQYYHAYCICGGLEILLKARLLIAFIRSTFKGVTADNPAGEQDKIALSSVNLEWKDDANQKLPLQNDS
jgi:hypothetical protein